MASNGRDDLSTSLSNLNINADENLRRSDRTRKMTAKAEENAILELKKQRDKLTKRIARQKEAIEDLLYSVENETTIKDELSQLNDLFILLQNVSLNPLKIKENNDWFDEEGEALCMFKRKIHNWLREAYKDREQRAESRAAAKTRSTVSKKSGSSRSSHSSSKSTSAIEERKKLKELEASAKFLEKKTELEMEAKRLELEESIARQKARVKAEEDEESKLNKGFALALN